MIRRFFILAAVLLTLSACSESPDSAATAPGNATIPTANQEQSIAVGKIAKDVVGKVVPITELDGDGSPTEWTFDADEFRQIEILEQQAGADVTTIVIFMTTRNNAGPSDDAVQVSGKLELRYERSGNKWVLKSIQNISFRYTVGLAA